MQRLIVISDYACPFSYLAHVQLERVRDMAAIEIETSAFELRPPGTALPAVDAVWSSSEWRRTVQPLAGEIGAEIRYPALITRTRKAHEAVAYAREHGAAAALHGAIYHAYWRDGRDIGRIDVLMDLAIAAGLDGTALKVALDIDQWTGRVEQEEAGAARLGIGGVPAYVRVVDGEAVEVRSGLQHDDELRDWVMGNHDV